MHNISKVLVVDDSKVAHLTLRKLLTERSIEVDWVGSGEDSITYLKDHRPDAIFMDVMMPGMDGFQAAGMITKEGNAPPVIMCSANATEEDHRNASDNGAVEFLSKPYTADELDQILDKIRQMPELTIDESVAEPELTVAEPEPVAEPELTVAEPEPAAPAAAEPAAPMPDMLEIADTAERLARTTAERTARDVASDQARTVAERVVADAIEQARQAADGVAREIAQQQATAVAEQTARTITEQLAREIARSVATEVAQSHAPKSEPIDPEQLRTELTQAVEGRVTRRVPELVMEAMQGEAFKKQIAELAREAALPVAQKAAQDAAAPAATKAAEQAVQPFTQDKTGEGAMSRANIALGVGALGLIAAIVAIIL